MSFFLDIPFKKSPHTLSYTDSLFLIGSCFTEHIGNKLEQLHFNVLQNPHGILFDSYAIAHALNDYISQKEYTEHDLFESQELWHSWAFHSHFSASLKADALQKMNKSIKKAHQHLSQSNWLVITLGSAFSYYLHADATFVANCHKVNQCAFQKNLVPISTLQELWKTTIVSLQRFNKNIKIIFTISPVRHIRDGVVENNRSKARLLETVHSLVDQQTFFYFPAYEYQIDILRDYRFYDTDLVHPNFAATEFIFQKFLDIFLHENDFDLLEEMRQLRNAYHHRPLHPETNAHQQFKEKQLIKSRMLQKKYPFLNLDKEILFFSS